MTGEKRSVWWPIGIALVILSVADVITTKLLLDAGGTEVNPFVALFVGSPGYYAVKTIGVGAVVAVVLYNSQAVWLVRFFYAVTAAYGVVVLANTIQLIAGGAV